MARAPSGSRASSRWLAAGLLLAMGSLLMGGAWFFLVQRQHLRAAAEADLLAIARLKAEQIERWRAERLGDASVLCEDGSVVRGLVDLLAGVRSAESQRLTATLRSMMNHYGYGDALAVSAGGEVRASLAGRLHALPISTSEALAASFRDRRAMLTDLYPDPLTLEPHLDVIAPILPSGPAGAPPVGAIVLCCRAGDFLFPLIEEWPSSSETAETLLVRREGDDVLYLNELRHQNDTALRLRIPLGRTETPAVQAVNGAIGIVYGADYRGVRVIAAVRPVADSPWFIVAKADAAEVLAHWRLSAILILAFLLGLALAGAIAAGFVLQRREKERLRSLLAEATLREASEERYRMTLLSVGDGVIATDAAGTVRMMNPVAESLTGWKSAEAVGRPLEEVFRIVSEATRQAAENPVRRVVREGRIAGLANHTLLIARDGTEHSIADSAAPIRLGDGSIQGVVLVFRDATEERRHRRERETTLALLGLLNSENLVHDLVRSITGLLQRSVGCEAVGIRLKDGDDYPYVETRGFPQEFVRLESSLCARRDDGSALLDAAGKPALECMCGNILSGRFDPSKPFFTPKGTFWTNSTTELLATTSEADRLARTRNRCNGEGYESVALVPLRHGGQTFGLIQFNDRAINRFTPELLQYLENVADQIAVGLSHRQMAHALAESEEHYRSLFENMLNGFAFCRMIYDGGRPVDFVYLEVNRAFETLTGLHGAAGRRVSELIPRLREQDHELIEIYGRVALTGIPERFETFVNALGEWFSVSVYSPRKDHFVAVFDVITERKKAEAGRLLLAQAIDQADEMIVITDPAGSIQYVNPAFERVTGFAREEVMGRTPRILKSGEQDPEFYRDLWATISSGRTWRGRLRNRRKDGTLYSEDATISPVIDAKGVIVNYVAAKRDISRESLLEEQLRQAQKMESVGRLAGGVAHDFNNMLHVIVNYVERAVKEAGPSEGLQTCLREIQKAAMRSVELTGQLLAFARKQTINPKVLVLNEEVAGMTKMLQRLIGEDIDLSWRPGSPPALTRIDPAQIGQILANLVVNARDAIAGVGTIIIETGLADFDEEYCATHPGYLAGEYLQLAVSDNGSGMDRETLSHLFEPFFTTKPLGKGTGLGLATVYGIVRQNNGFINVYSEPGKGTTFRIYLPRLGGGEAPARGAEPLPAWVGGTETILVVEDEEAILTLSTAALQELGYSALAARSPDAAIELVRGRREPIHLLITDVVMPKMDGRELAAALARLQPQMKFLYMSGYTADVIAHQGVLEEGVQFISKPFAIEALARKVREVLDS